MLGKCFKMLKKVICISISTIFFMFIDENVYANSKIKPPTFEEKFAEVGYKTVEEAEKEFETFCKCEVELPTTIPSISFTHKFGRFFQDTEYNMNNNLEIMYVNEDVRENIFKIEIRPLKNKQNFEGNEYKLLDGEKGVYFEHQIFNFFVFENNGLQYLIGIHKQKELAKSKTPDFLVDIANSIIK